MRRAVRRAPQAKRHEIPAWVGAPLWAAGNFAKRHWRAFAWFALVIAVGYMPYFVHRHAHYIEDRRCDKINYAAQVAYQYGCAGRDCSPDLVHYEQQVLMTYGALKEGCYAAPPVRPDEAISMFVNAGANLLKDIQDAGKAMPEEAETQVTIVAEAS